MSKAKTKKKSGLAKAYAELHPVRVNKGRKATAGLARLLADQKPKTTTVSYDWKDTAGAGDEFRAALKKFGIYVYDMPSMDGSDTYGYILSDCKLTKAEIAKADPYSEENS